MTEGKMKNFLTTDIYGLTAEEFSAGRGNIEVVEKMLTAGIKFIQYREKDKKARDMYHECLKIRELTKAAGATFLINDHIDLAMVIDADGVHIGQDDLPPGEVRRLLGPDKIIGLSTHSSLQAEDAVKAGVDYIGVGPVFTTQTKKDVCAAVGFEYLDYVVKNIALPFVAIGGIKEHNIKEVRAHGARMIALVTEIVGASDIVDKVKSIREAMQ
jgi:thiamine-phosphate pyrophosphorylase